MKWEESKKWQKTVEKMRTKIKERDSEIDKLQKSNKMLKDMVDRYVRQYSKTCLKRPLKKNTKLVCKTDYHLMQVKSIAECSKGSILQYFRSSLSYHLSLRYLFCLFLSGRLRQVLLYVYAFVVNITNSLKSEYDQEMPQSNTAN